MLVRWPGVVRPARVDGTPWAFCDVLPTLAAAAGARTPANLDGVNLLPLLHGKPAPAREYLYWEQQNYSRETGKLRLMTQAVRMGDWKAIRPKPGAALELYNLREDPSESRDVAAANRALAGRAEGLMREAHSDARPHDTGSYDFAT
jgi:arylsulfatase A-like enzyme